MQIACKNPADGNIFNTHSLLPLSTPVYLKYSKIFSLLKRQNLFNSYFLTS